MNSNLRTGKHIIPEPLQAGDWVAITALAGPPAADLLDKGLSKIQSWNFAPTIFVPSTCSSYLAGCDAERIDCFNVPAANPLFKALFVARGGYGTMRILDALDYNLLVENPKIILGMSDITALQLSIYNECKYSTLSGPMVAGQLASEMDPITERYLYAALTTDFSDCNLWPDSIPVSSLRSGFSRGPLLGGCLSLVCSLIGTRHSPDYAGCILFLEDVNEPLYRIDRMLTHLRLAGVFDVVSGLVLGYFKGVNGEDLSFEVGEIIQEMTGRGIPIICGFPHGHALPNITLPHGRGVTLDTAGNLLQVTSPVL